MSPVGGDHLLSAAYAITLSCSRRFTLMRDVRRRDPRRRCVSCSRRNSLEKNEHRNRADHDQTMDRVAGSLADRRAARGAGPNRDLSDKELDDIRRKGEAERHHVMTKVTEMRWLRCTAALCWMRRCW